MMREMTEHFTKEALREAVIDLLGRAQTLVERDGLPPARAFLLAGRNGLPDRARRTTVGMVGRWIVESTDPSWEEADAFPRALARLTRSPEDDPLAREFAELASGIEAGAISDDELYARTQRPVRVTRTDSPTDSDAPPIDRASELLRDGLRPDCSIERDRAWEAFKEFASAELSAGVAQIESDLLLFQWGEERSLAYWDLTRQLAISDPEIGSRLEQIHCTLHFAPEILAGIEAGEIWSSGDLDRWIEEVEASAAFQAVEGLKSDSVDVSQETV